MSTTQETVARAISPHIWRKPDSEIGPATRSERDHVLRQADSVLKALGLLDAPAAGDADALNDTPLGEALRDLFWRAVRYGETADGDVAHYLFTKGTVHRLMGHAQGAGIRVAFRDSDDEHLPDEWPDVAAVRADALAPVLALFNEIEAETRGVCVDNGEEYDRADYPVLVSLDAALAGDRAAPLLRAERADALREAADAARGMHDPPAPDCAEWADWLDARADEQAAT